MIRFETFLSISEVIIPPSDKGDKGASGDDFRERAKEFFDNMPLQAHITFSMICLLIDINSMIRYGKQFSKLPAEKREEILRRWERSKIMQKRVMFNAIKGLVSLVFMSLERSMPELKKDDEICLVE